MIDPITLHILEEQGVLEGYCLKCAICGKQIEIVKDGQGKLSCCNQRMFVMSSNPTSENKIEEKKMVKKALKKIDKIGKKGIFVKKYIPAEKRILDKNKKVAKESVENLEELTKTRSGKERAARRIFDPAYIQRKRDLLKLRKQPAWYRKSISQKIKKKEKISPGFLKKVAKAPELKGDKVIAAQSRRQAAQKFGGYNKTAAWKQREKEKIIRKKAEASTKKKELEKSLASQKAKRKAEYDKLLQKRLEKVRAYHNKDIEKKRAARKAKITSAKKTGASAEENAKIKKMSKYKKKDFNPGTFMSLESTDLDFQLDKDISDIQEYTKNPDGSITFSASDIEKARERSSTYSGTRKHNQEEYNKKYGASSIKGFLKMLRGEGFTNNDLKQLISEVLIEAEGMGKLPKGWTQDSLKKFSKSLTGKEGTKEGFFKKCVAKMKGKMDNPEGFCASVKDELHGSTYWRGKGKTPQQAGKDVKAHKNVKRD